MSGLAPSSVGATSFLPMPTVVVVPRPAAAEIARLGPQRVANEQKSRERLRNGELGLDFYGFRAKLTDLGVRYVDEEDESEK